MTRTVVIDHLPESVARYVRSHAIVAVDVIRAATTAVTAVALGRRCFPVSSLTEALRLRRQLDNPLLVGELGGRRPPGFGMHNSPAELAMRTDVARPVILLSTSGTRLMHGARGAEAAYVACFRNAAALAAQLANRHRHIAVIGAGSRGEFREEDQICCAWIAAELLRAGYAAADRATTEVVARWGEAPAVACVRGKSAAYLRRTGQRRDLDFVLAHVNDLDGVFALADDQVVRIPAARRDDTGVGTAPMRASGAR